MVTQKQNALSRAAVTQLCKDAFFKLDPRAQSRNPVMFVVYVGSLFSTFLALQAVWQGADNVGFVVALTLWLWFTLLFANFAEAYAEGKSKAQAASLKALKQTVSACRITQHNGQEQRETVVSSTLRLDDVVYVAAGELVPMDGEVIEGVASVDESAITGESAPVIRAAGSDFCSVTGGTRLVSDWLKIRVNANPGESFVDQMIGMVEGAKRQKTPNEVALTIVLVTLTVIFLIVVATLLPFSLFAANAGEAAQPLAIVSLIALLVCLIPTTIGGLLSAIGVAGMSRMMAKNVVAKSGRAVETAGNIDVLLLDKTGTITFGNRQASAFYPAVGIRPADFAQQAWLASQADDTPEGRSIVALAQIKQPELGPEALSQQWPNLTAVPFTAQTRMSGVDVSSEGETLVIRKGAAQAIKAYVEAMGGEFPSAVQKQVAFIASEGATPLVVAVGERVIGCLALKDVVKPN
ncbi:MAG: potassium-transporting ATPase subunit KdpB, partial [Neisseriaceae bacterium]|nr:potassium-transporting ATPase subunit KdpB [Neisseriaceae bacterium]